MLYLLVALPRSYFTEWIVTVFSVYTFEHILFDIMHLIYQCERRAFQLHSQNQMYATLPTEGVLQKDKSGFHNNCKILLLKNMV